MISFLMYCDDYRIFIYIYILQLLVKIEIHQNYLVKTRTNQDFNANTSFKIQFS
jgi:hypothetical protein